MVPPAPRMNRGFIAGVKKHEFALHPGSRCNTSVLFLSRPLSRTTDAITAWFNFKDGLWFGSRGGKKKSQANQKSPSAALPWGYSSPINVLFAKITDNSTIKGGRWRAGGIKERSSDTRGEKWKREKREKQETEKKWEREEHGLLRKNDKWTN